MKTAGVCSILMGNRTQWGWREVRAAEGEEPRWPEPGCLGAGRPPLLCAGHGIQLAEAGVKADIPCGGG